jgi:Branched-chain amino acid transport system / permease component
VLAAGMTFVILTGGIDLSVGSILAASAMAGLTVSKLPELGALWLPAAVLTGLAFGVINGALIALLRLPPFIVTLGSLTAVRGLARLLGADTTVFNPSIPYAFIGNGSLTLVPGVASIPWLSVIALLVILVSWLVLRRTVLGVHIYAAGGNESAARLAGIKVWAVLIFVYGVSGLLAGLGGAMQAARLYAADRNSWASERDRDRFRDSATRELSPKAETHCLASPDLRPADPYPDVHLFRVSGRLPTLRCRCHSSWSESHARDRKEKDAHAEPEGTVRGGRCGQPGDRDGRSAGGAEGCVPISVSRGGESGRGAVGCRCDG